MDFFTYLLVFLMAGLFFVFLFTRLGLGAILGYLVAGIAIGPFALNAVQEADFLHEVSELGLVFFLFLIGLELSPKRIWHMKRAVFALGPSQLLITGLCLSIVCHFWLDSWIQSFLMGAGLALSSTAIGVQLLAEKNEVTSPEGQDALGILIFQDLAVIPLLAILSSSQATLSWSSFAKPVGAVLLVILGGIFIIPRALRFLAYLQRQELFIAAALLLVIGVAVLMRNVGLSMGLGAFIGGALLANSEFRHELQTDIEPFKSLLFGLFFISMGVSLDMGFLSHVALPLILASIGLLTLKTLTNFIALYATRLSRLSHATRVAPLLAQGGEFAFVLFGLAAAQGIFSKEVATFCVGVIGLSMALTPTWYYLTQRLMKRFRSSAKKYDFNVVHQNPEVVIAGYGRFGQIIHRVLRLHQIPVTILESNHEQVEFVKKFDTKVFYGDATRLDLLRTAGVADAKLFVLAIDQPVASIRTAEILRKHFSNIRIFARARNREHSLRLMSLGIPQKDIVRETLHSSLALTEDILLHLGMSCTMTAQTIDSFLKHDAEVLAGQVQYIDNEEELIQFTKKSSAELQKVFESDQPVELNQASESKQAAGA